MYHPSCLSKAVPLKLGLPKEICHRRCGANIDAPVNINAIMGIDVGGGVGVNMRPAWATAVGVRECGLQKSTRHNIFQGIVCHWRRERKHTHITS